MAGKKRGLALFCERAYLEKLSYKKFALTKDVDDLVYIVAI